MITIPDDPWKPFTIGGRTFQISLADRHYQTLWDVTDKHNRIEVGNFIGLPGARLSATIEAYLAQIEKRG